MQRLASLLCLVSYSKTTFYGPTCTVSQIENHIQYHIAELSLKFQIKNSAGVTCWQGVWVN